MVGVAVAVDHQYCRSVLVGQRFEGSRQVDPHRDGVARVVVRIQAHWRGIIVGSCRGAASLAVVEAGGVGDSVEPRADRRPSLELR